MDSEERRMQSVIWEASGRAMRETYARMSKEEICERQIERGIADQRMRSTPGASAPSRLCDE